MKKSWFKGLVLTGSLGALVAIFLLTQGCAGCGRYGKAYKAAKQLSQTAKEYEKEAKEMASRPPVEPVNWRELMKFVPENVPGYEAQEPSGETMSMSEDVKWSHAKREYTAGDKSISIDIIDSGYRQVFWALGFAWFIQGEYDSSEGYLKNAKVKGQEAKINWKIKDKSGTLIVKVANRFFVNIEGDNLPGDQELVKAAEQINYNGLGRLK